MHPLINQLAFSVFQQNNIQQCSPEELQKLVNQYPYYSVAQLLYTARLKELNNGDYQHELQKTSLFFNSSLWLKHLLSEKHKEELVSEKTDPLEKIIYEEANNDEWVVENPRPDVFNILPELKEKLSEISLAIQNPVSESAPAFEPFHTVDYFASQGIKEQVEEKPADRFGQQLRSFTEWLKTLKTTAIQDNTGTLDKNAEEKVILLADHSVEDRNVETEAMAEVWIKQGQPEKALAIYNKLSLLNPSKSSYFANLIENLKKN